MKIEYRRDLQHSYLVLRVEEKTEEPSYAMKMITRNQIRGLLTCECRRIDDDILYYYDLTSRISLADRCSAGKLSGEEVVLVVYSFLQLLDRMEEYLLSGTSLYLKPEHIYVDAQMKEVSFCYVPGKSWDLEIQFRELMEGMLPFLDHKNQDEVLAVYGIYHYAVREHFSTDGLRQQLESCRRNSPEPERPAETIREQDVQRIEQKRHEEALDAFFQDEDPEEKNTAVSPAAIGAAGILVYLLSGWFLWRSFPGQIWIWAVGGILMGAGMMLWYRRKKEEIPDEQEDTAGEKEEVWKNDFRNTEWTERSEQISRPEYDCATQILGRGRKRMAYLLEETYPEPGRQVIFGEKEIQFLGCLKGTADLLLPSQAVSRLHARIRRSGENYYLCDLNSRNGTWVNEQELQGEQEREIKAGDEIKFADLIYRLRQL